MPEVEDIDPLEEGHLPHIKHVQLGVALSDVGEDPVFASEDEFDAIWEDATTVEQYKADIDLLAGKNPDGSEH